MPPPPTPVRQSTRVHKPTERTPSETSTATSRSKTTASPFQHDEDAKDVERFDISINKSINQFSRAFAAQISTGGRTGGRLKQTYDAHNTPKGRVTVNRVNDEGVEEVRFIDSFLH